jgi:hypothetical protein
MNSCGHFCENADPRTDHRQKFAEMKMVPLRPK